MYFVGCSAQWEFLQFELNQTQHQAFSSGTVKNLLSHWKSFLTFCKYFRLATVPATPNTIASFVQFMARTCHSFTYLRSLVSSIKLLHQCYGIDFEPTKFLQVKTALSGLHRSICVPPAPKLPITPEILLRLKSVINFDNQLHLNCWTIFLVAFFSFLRKSNLIPDSGKQVANNSGHYLRRRSVHILSDGVLISIESSKTDNFGENKQVIPFIRARENPLCPVTAIDKLVQAIPAEPDDPFFVLRSGTSTFPVTYPMACKLLKSLLLSLGYDPSRYALHSFRRGGCTFAHESGIDTECLRIHGNWRSNAYQAYIKPNCEQQLKVSKTMLDNINCKFIL